MIVYVRMLWLMISEHVLLVVVLDTMFGLMLNIVEQLIVFMLNVTDNLLSAVVFNIVWVEIMVIFLLVMVISFPVSMSFVVSMMKVEV